jgi:hypothetical protein
MKRERGEGGRGGEGQREAEKEGERGLREGKKRKGKECKVRGSDG